MTTEDDWAGWSLLARRAARLAVEAWFRSCRAWGGGHDGAQAWLDPGALRSDAPFERIVLHETMARGGPRHVAAAFATELAAAWGAWFAGYAVRLSLDPELGVAAPVSIRVGSSSADYRLTASRLEEGIVGRLGAFAEEPGAGPAIADFANWFGACFSRWRARAVLQQVSVDPEGPGLTTRVGVLSELGEFATRT